MNKGLFLTKTIVLIISIILLVICQLNYLTSIINTYLVYLTYLTAIIIFIISLIDILKKKEHVNLNNQYNIIFTIATLCLILIMLRGVFDPLIISNSFQFLGDNVPDSRMLFVGNNLIYFVIINTCLILYRFTIKNSNKNKEKSLQLQ